MEDLFAKCLKLLQARSFYNKCDADIIQNCQALFKFIFDSQGLQPNIPKMLRFCEEVDPSGYSKMLLVAKQLISEYMNKIYKKNLLTIKSALEVVSGKGDIFEGARNQQAERAQLLKRYQEHEMQRNLRVVGLQQARLRYQQVQSIYVQLQTAFSMLDQSSSSKTLLEQKYFHQEFAKLAKQLKVKFLTEQLDSQKNSFDLHGNMLMADLRTQVQRSADISAHKKLFVKCFGTQKFNETLHRAMMSYVEQYYQAFAFRSLVDVNEVDVYEFMSWLSKFFAVLQYQIDEDLAGPKKGAVGGHQRQTSNVTSHVSQSGMPSSVGSDVYGGPGELARLISLDYQTIIEVCQKYISKVTWYYQGQKILSIDQMVKILLLLTKVSMQMEHFFAVLAKESGELDPNLISANNQQTYKQIDIIIKHATRIFRDKLKLKFVINDASFDKWISVENSNELLNSIWMQELQEVAPQIDSSFNQELFATFDQIRHEKKVSEECLYSAFIYSFALNQDLQKYIEYIAQHPAYVPGKNQEKLEVQNMKMVPMHFYQTISYINDFMMFLKLYAPDFDSKLIIGSTVNCVTTLISPPDNHQQKIATELPFILDERLLICQIKLLSNFAELIEYEGQIFRYYYRQNPDDVMAQSIYPVLIKMLTQQINFRSALRSLTEYKKTVTVTQGSKLIFERIVFFQRLVNPYPRIALPMMRILINQLELNLIDHYSQLMFDAKVLSVVTQEIQFLQQTFFGLIKVESLLCVEQFVALPGQSMENYQHFKDKWVYKFDIIRFKELMMRMANQAADRDGCMHVVKSWKVD